MPKRLEQEKIDQVIELCKNNKTIKEIEAATGVGNASIYKILKGASLFRKSTKTTDRDNLIIKDYLLEPNPANLAKLYNVDISTIYNVLKRLKIKPITPKRIYRYKCDEAFFSKINTEQKAYWVGFITADGFCSHKGSYKCLSIKLSVLDEAHLALFVRHINGNFPVRKIKVITGDLAEVRIYNPSQLAEDLCANHGMDNHKTFTIDWDKIVKHIPENLMRFFLLGFNDGDGTFYTENTKGKGRIRFETGCKVRDFMEKMNNYLIEKAGIQSQKVMYHKGKDFWRVGRSKRSDIEKLYSYFYKDTTIFLKRKKDKVKNFYSQSLNLDIDKMLQMENSPVAPI